jgi:hypothetical protein
LPGNPIAKPSFIGPALPVPVLEAVNHRYADCSRKAGRYVRVAMGVNVISAIEEVFDIRLNPNPFVDRVEECQISPKETRNDNGVVDPGEHIRAI